MPISPCAYEKISELIDRFDIDNDWSAMQLDNIRMLLQLAPELTIVERHELHLRLHLLVTNAWGDPTDLR